jgi:hypothetical protein
MDKMITKIYTIRVDMMDIVAQYFANKVKDILKSVKCENSVYNGWCRVISTEKIFMDILQIRECMATLKIKNRW